MFSIRNILSISLLLTLSSSLVHPHQLHQESHDQEELSGLAGLQKLLDQVDAPSLHAALHDLSPKKFKHGMFQDDRTAVEAIHKDEPSLATSVVNVAKRNVMEDIKKDLAKRQDISNGTTTSTTPAPVVAGSSSTSSIVTPVPQGGGVSSSTTPIANQGTSTTPAGQGSSTPSPTPTSTSSNGAVAAGTTGTSTPASAGVSPSATDTSSSSLSRGEVITSTNSVGLTIVSTVGGGVHTITPSSGGSTSSSKTQSSTTSTVVHTSTLPNGSQSVVTAVTVVGAGGGPADTPTGAAGVATTGTSSGSPGLQMGEATSTRGLCKEMVLVVGGAVGFAMMM